MHTVLFRDENGNEKTFELEDNEIIYDGLAERHLELPHGCLSGSCGSCKVLICEGADHLSPPRTVEADTIAHVTETYKKLHGEKVFKGYPLRLSCRARVKGNITIELIKND